MGRLEPRAFDPEIDRGAESESPESGRPDRAAVDPDEGGGVPELSIVIPVLDEGENVLQLCREIRMTLDSVLDYEVIFVDDGSRDHTVELIRTEMTDARVRLLRHSRTAGQSKAVRTGVKAARASRVATLDGDCQNDPADLIKLWERAVSSGEGPTLVMGQRTGRKDTWLKRLSSRVANSVRRIILADECSDSGCGIRMFDRAAVLDLPSFDHMHRFLPALFRAAGLPVSSVPVGHRPRIRGRSKYGIWDRLWIGIIDLFGVLWLRKRANPGVQVREER